MQSQPTTSVSKARLWTGRVISALPALFLLLDGAMKLPKPSFVVEATTQLGYPESMIVPLGVVVLVCTILYVIPQTAVLGAVLLTGYLGGAVASHARHEDGTFAIVFPAVFGAFIWGGLVLRDARLAALVPWRNLSTEPAGHD
ncbi:MAG TPA: DoxX family protein [Pirellulales bacterium]|nr:DoxX family protein [Pirellulales bacterium]